MGRSIVNPSEHGGDQTDSENIIRISIETDTRDNTGTNVEPAELGVVDLKGPKSVNIYKK